MERANSENTFLFNSKLDFYREWIHIQILKLTRNKKKFPLVTKNDLDKVKKIILNLFPNETDFGWSESPSKMCAYVLCADLIQVYHLTTENYCIVVASHYKWYEISNFLAMDGKCADFFEVFDFLLKNFRHKPFLAICREKTSYPLIKQVEKLGVIRIIVDKELKKDEMLHVVKFKAISNK